MPTDLPASPWTAASRRPQPAMKRQCTACCRRAFSLPRGDGLGILGATRTRRVRRAALAAILATCISSLAATAQSLRVVATTGDLASLARAVTGGLAEVETFIPPATDPEAFEPRPSDLARLKGASLVVRVGLGY